MDGIINIYKEKGFTSHDVVAKMRGILKQKKIGHTGTLDPQAEGVLPVCLGKGTKLCAILTDWDKEYEAVLRLGITTDTEDMTGKIISERVCECKEEELREVIFSFLGNYNQIPPMYSALKVKGRKLYELAREGKVIERKPRAVFIKDIQILNLSLPEVRLRVCCSKGTYIRSLCRDIGEKIGCGAAMSSLKRIRTGKFCISDALTLDRLEEIRDSGELASHIMTVEEALAVYPKAKADKKFETLLYNGNPLQPSQCGNPDENAKCLRMYDSNDCFVALYTYDIEKKRWKPEKMFF